MRRAERSEGALERRDLDPAFLLGRRPGMTLEIVVRHLGRDVLPRDHAAEAVAQDREQPGLEIGARRELVLRLQRVDHRVLHDVVGEVNVPSGQAAREGPQMGHQRRNLLPK